MPRLASVSEAQPFEVATVSHDAGRSIVRVTGELDLATCSDFEAALTAMPAGERIVLDLTGCTFLDSSAIRVVLSSARVAAENGGALTIVTSDPGVLRTLEIANVEARVPIHGTLEAALAATGG